MKAEWLGPNEASVMSWRRRAVQCVKVDTLPICLLLVGVGVGVGGA